MSARTLAKVRSPTPQKTVELIANFPPWLHVAGFQHQAGLRNPVKYWLKGKHGLIRGAAGQRTLA